MKSIVRCLSVAVACSGLLGVFGCAEDNEKAVKGDSQNTKVDPNGPTAGDYGKMQPKVADKNPYEASGKGYPGSGKAKAK